MIILTVTNLVAVTFTLNVAIQSLHTGQTAISPLTVGGSGQRNQVFHQDLFAVGKDQNSTHKYLFNIPKQFQRVRAGDSWNFTINGNAVYANSMLVIYKFYR